MKNRIILYMICYAFVLLFAYTALNKWFLYDIYLYDLKRSPELKHFAVLISLVIPAAELLVSGLLLFDRTRKLGLVGALVLMSFFTLYVTYVLAFTNSRPCTCGGIIRELSWPNHLIFNICFTALAIFGLYLDKKMKKSQDNNQAIEGLKMI